MLPHERTLPKAKRDRLALLRATRANLDPIWGLSLAAGLTRAIGTRIRRARSRRRRRGGQPPRALAARSTAARVAAIRAVIGSAPLVLADGHHRFETACTYRREQPDDDPGAGAIMALVVELDRGRALRARRSTGCCTARTRPRGLGSPATFDGRRRSAAAAPEASPRSSPRCARAARSASSTRRRSRCCTSPRRRPAPGSPTCRQCCATSTPRASTSALLPLLGDVELAYRDDASTCAALVDKGAADAAVLLRPVTVAQIRAAAVAGVRMPEKTTFFAPKPRTGMVFRTLDV